MDEATELLDVVLTAMMEWRAKFYHTKKREPTPREFMEYLIIVRSVLLQHIADNLD